MWKSPNTLVSLEFGNLTSEIRETSTPKISVIQQNPIVCNAPYIHPNLESRCLLLFTLECRIVRIWREDGPILHIGGAHHKNHYVWKIRASMCVCVCLQCLMFSNAQIAQQMAIGQSYVLRFNFIYIISN